MDNPFDPSYREPEPSASLLDELDREPVKAQPREEPKTGHICYHDEFEQGSEQWHAARRGLLTASEMKLIITPSALKIASNDKVRTHLYELLAQRVTGYVEPHFQSYDMERGNFEEERAREKYSETYAPVTECGFVTNDEWGFTLGYSPDGLVGDDGLIEIKSRIQKLQMQTLIEWVTKQAVPADFVMQVQTGLLITRRKWLDFISYSGGMVMSVTRAYPDPVIQNAIVEASGAFEAKLSEARKIYDDLIASNARLVPTERLLYL